MRSLPLREPTTVISIGLCEIYREKKSGECTARAPSLDHLRRQSLLSREEIEKRLELDLQKPAILVAYHTVTIAHDTLQEVEVLFTALGNVREQILFCYPKC